MKFFFGVYIALLVGVCTLWAATPLRAAQDKLSTDVAQMLLTKINAARIAKGMAVLTSDKTLASLAEAHSADMYKKEYFSHNDSAGCNSSCRMTSVGYPWLSAGENIYTSKINGDSAEEISASILNAWLKDPVRAANLFNPSFTTTGVGVSLNLKVLYVTDDFAAK